MNQTNDFQQTLKKALSYITLALGAFIAAGASGQVSISHAVLGWMGVIAAVLGIFGASPIGRVVGVKESHAPLEAEAPPLFPPDGPIGKV